MPRWAIAARLGISTEALGRPRHELVDRGLIEAGGRGQLRFTIPGFGAYIRAISTALSSPQSMSPDRSDLPRSRCSAQGRDDET